MLLEYVLLASALLVLAILYAANRLTRDDDPDKRAAKRLGFVLIAGLALASLACVNIPLASTMIIGDPVDETARQFERHYGVWIVGGTMTSLLSGVFVLFEALGQYLNRLR